MLQALRRHWPEYLIEALGLGLFMVSAAGFGTLLEYPGSPVHQALPNATVRRALMGLLMGATAVGIIYSPFGKRSGAHLNPAVTLTFLRLRKLAAPDAVFYVLAQFAGGLLGLLLAAAVLGSVLAEPPVRFVTTTPGPGGSWLAFAAELAISFGMMMTVLVTSNSQRTAALTGLFAGGLVATWITIEAPLSGMSMNPARTLASALPAQLWQGLWVYFTAPVVGMLLAAEVYVRAGRRVRCAKLHHDNFYRCIFRCDYHV